MASKKGKRSKRGQTLNIHDFNAPVAKTDDSREVVVSQTDWASESGEMDFGQYPEAPKTVSLPTAPRSAREKSFDLTKAPDRPPFKLFIGNLSYDADPESITSFFDQANAGTVIGVELVKEFDRPKGFGYVEFKDKGALIAALDLDGLPLFKRNIRVDFANESDRKTVSGDGRRNRDQPSGISDSDDNWRNGPRTVVAGRDYDRAPPRREGYDGGFGRPQEDSTSGLSSWRSAATSRPDAPSRNEPSKSRPRLKLVPRSVPDGETASSGSKSSSIFGAAKPVDTSKKLLEVEERVQTKERSQLERRDEDRFVTRDIRPNVERRIYNAAEPCDDSASHSDKPSIKKPSATDIFGAAKPVDTAARDRELEGKRLENSVGLAAPQPEKPIVQKPTATDVFGAAKPVDTAARDREIEAKLAEKEAAAQQSEHQASEPRHIEGHHIDRSQASEPRRIEGYRDRLQNDEPRRIEYKRKTDGTERKLEERKPLRDANGNGSAHDSMPAPRESRHGRKKEKAVPTSIEDMPKLEENCGVKLNIQNPFGGMEIEGEDSDD